jgi:5-methylcytosine-specific restriction protein A
MPRRWKTICRAAGCMIALDSPGYCAGHAHIARGAWETTRTSSAARGYGHRWGQLRTQVLIRDRGLCQVCATRSQIGIATEVDHIVAKAAGGSDAIENLQAICHPCHVEKTAADRRVLKSKQGGGPKSFGPL